MLWRETQRLCRAEPIFVSHFTSKCSADYSTFFSYACVTSKIHDCQSPACNGLFPSSPTRSSVVQFGRCAIINMTFRLGLQRKTSLINAVSPLLRYLLLLRHRTITCKSTTVLCHTIAQAYQGERQHRSV